MLSGTARRGRRGARTARTSGRQAARSRPMKMLARAGFAARGTMYILIGWLALQIALGSSGGPADSKGALLTVGSTALGSILLWLLGIGFVGLALWRLAQVFYGAPGPGGRKASARVLAGVKTALYGYLAYTTLRYAVGSGTPKSTDRQSVDLTATAMRYPAGQAVVVIAGLVVIGAGVYLIWTSWRRQFLQDLETGRMTMRQRRLATWLGQVGGVARGVVFGAAGIFLVVAGAEHQPGKAKGVDSTLRSFSHTPLGPLLLAVIAAGLVIFGSYSWLEARWRRV